MNILVPVIIGIVAILLFAVRRGPKPRDIARSLSPADRQFIADQIEPITKLPLNTAADEDAWLAAYSRGDAAFEGALPRRCFGGA